MLVHLLLILYIFSLKMKFKFKLQNREILEDNGKFIISEGERSRLFVECSYLTEETNKSFALHFWSQDGHSFIYWETSIEMLSLGMTINYEKTCDVW